MTCGLMVVFQMKFFVLFQAHCLYCIKKIVFETASWFFVNEISHSLTAV